MKNTGIELDNDNDDSDYKSNENELKKIVRELKKQVDFLNDKKNHYKAKVIFLFYFFLV